MTAALAESGTVTRTETCQKHGQQYPQIFFSSVQVWSGRCPDCETEEKLSARVDKLLAERRAEKWKRVDAIMLKRAPEIERAIDKSMLEENEERRAEWRAFHEGPMREEVEAEVEAKMRAEILEQFKKGA
jgi:hypothetical protein